MRETFISILALLAVAVPYKCSEIGKDGFNFYKDYLRGRSDDVVDEGPLESRVLSVTRRQSAQNAGSIATLNSNAYSLTEIKASIPITCGLYEKFDFYRTPLPLYTGMLPAALEQEYKKRTGNAFKNHMLSKEWDGGPNKRSSKTALSFLMQGKLPNFSDNRGSCYNGK